MPRRLARQRMKRERSSS
ncbi:MULTISPECIES: hypothetical protein [unclassified Variovorax]